MKSNTKVRDVLQWGTAQLKQIGVDSPALDAELLLAQVLKKDRAWLYAHGEMYQRGSTLKQYKRLIARRMKREPVAYIVGTKEFYGLDFVVNRHVMIPRPETEVLVEHALDEIRNWKLEIRNLCVVDVGTGSGVVVVTLAKNLQVASSKSKVKLFGTDISSRALAVARRNAHRHGVAQQIIILQGNLLEPLLSNYRDRAYLTTPDSHLIITANLPYLPTAEWRATRPEIRKWEPRGALDGGPDGLKYYLELFKQLSAISHKPLAIILCELCPHQFPAFQKMVRAFFPGAEFQVVKGLSRRVRVIIVRV